MIVGQGQTDGVTHRLPEHRHAIWQPQQPGPIAGEPACEQHHRAAAHHQCHTPCHHRQAPAAGNPAIDHQCARQIGRADRPAEQPVLRGSPLKATLQNQRSAGVERDDHAIPQSARQRRSEKRRVLQNHAVDTPRRNLSIGFHPRRERHPLQYANQPDCRQRQAIEDRLPTKRHLQYRANELADAQGDHEGHAQP